MVQTMKFLIAEPFPIPILIPLEPKYSLEAPVLNTFSLLPIIREHIEVRKSVRKLGNEELDSLPLI